MNDLMVIEQSREVLSHHAKTFRWAAQFLPPDRRDDAAMLYAVCREIDDAADEAESNELAEYELGQLERDLRSRRPNDPLIASFLTMARRREIPLQAVFQLLDGVKSDLDPVIVPDDDALLQYCYHVAGTVGLLMCGILGVDEAEAVPHAVDLGIGMQLTNICRDVLEDAARGRVYLPATRLRAHGVEPEELLNGTADRHAVAAVVEELLDMAEQYYASADAGMRYIPARPRLAILIASRAYRAIGIKLREVHQCDALHGRTHVTVLGKIHWTIRAFGTWLALPWWRPIDHRRQLHSAIEHLVAGG